LLGDALQGADQVSPLQILGLVRPQVFQLLGKVEIAKLVQHVAHQARLTDRLLDLLEAVLHHLPAADHARHRAGDLAQDVVRRVDRLLARRKRVGQRLDRLQARVHDGHREHPHAVLHAGRQRGHLGEDALVRLPGHDTRLRALRPAVGADHHDGRAEVLDKVPAGAGDGEQVHVGAHIAQDLDRRVVLEEQVHVDGDAADALEHGRGLHVVGVRAKAVETEKPVSTSLKHVR
jgi:hypothetical protein